MNDWYYLQGQTTFGPIADDVIRHFIHNGTIRQDTLVWRPSFPEWQPAGQTNDLAGEFSYTPMPQPTQSVLDPSLPEAKSRSAAGLLNIFLPGVGRLYLGYSTIGVLELLLTIFTCGCAWLWPLIDGIMILSGSLTKDAEGRTLSP
jgi:hypothetical protein